MKYTYHLTYSCYDNQMQILLNGNETIASNSSVLQYMNEPFYEWHDKIFDLLYKELGDNYTVIYTGRPEEAEILKTHVKKNGGCIGLEEKEFSSNQTVQQRIIGLSRLIKQNHLTILPPIQMNAVFLGGEEMIDRYENQIQELEIGNQYCSTSFSVRSLAERKSLKKTDIPFLLAGNMEEAERMAAQLPACKYAFILVENGQENQTEQETEEDNIGFRKASGKAFFYGISEDEFTDVIFQCFLLFPLAECFSTYAGNMIKNREKDDIYYQMKALMAVKPVLRIGAESMVECGRSLPFDIQVYPKGQPVPELVFEYQLNGIVQCSQQGVMGLKPGKTMVRVFEKGTAELIESFSFTVYTRNRITAFLMSDMSVTMGTGSTRKISCEYMPADADNADQIYWYSDDQSVAVVEDDGSITAIAPGTCQICCTAEGVTGRCDVTVKPFLEDIILPDVVSERLQEGVLRMKAGERLNMECVAVPADAYDGQLIYGSNNLMVANLENRSLVAVSSGEADITIESPGGRIRRVIHVIVGRGKKEKKRGLFGLFG